MRQLAVYTAFRVGMAVVGVLPMRVAQRLGQLGGLVAYLGARGRREMAIRHARRLGASHPRRHARRMFAAYGRYWAEAFWFRPRRLDQVQRMVEVEGIERVRAAKAEGRGMIFALPHMGNWELAGSVGMQEGIDLWAVAENLRNRRIRDWFVELRNRLGIGIVLATGGSEVMRQLEEIVKANGGVALLCDRDLRGKGVAVEFFGERTTLPGGPASLSARTGAPIFPVGVYFTPEGGHRVVVRPAIEFPAGVERKEAIRRTTQWIADELEALVRRDPEQWHLLQPNWPSDHEAIGSTPPSP